MHRRTFLVGSASLLAGCATTDMMDEINSRAVSPGSVDVIHVMKKDRLMRLGADGRTVRQYRIGLGFAPEGPKRVRGDGRTPEGKYRIDRRNGNSAFHLSLGLSYPSPEDRLRARAMGRDPGGNIFIHGSPNGARLVPSGDWTLGCIAVRNAEIEEMWDLVPVGCRIVIDP